MGPLVQGLPKKITIFIQFCGQDTFHSWQWTMPISLRKSGFNQKSPYRFRMPGAGQTERHTKAQNDRQCHSLTQLVKGPVNENYLWSSEVVYSSYNPECFLSD